MRLIDADELLNEFDRLDLDYGATGGVAECIAITEQAPTIDPNELDLDIDYSIEYEKRPDGISNAKVTITRIKPKTIVKPIVNDCDLISRQLLIGAIEKCGEEKIYPQALIEVIKALPSAEQVTSKLKNPCDSLLTEDSAESKEQKSKLKGKSADICIIDEPSGDKGGDAEMRNDRTYTHAPYMQQSPNNGADLISREDAIEVANKIVEELSLSSIDWDDLKHWAKELFEALPSADRPKGEWVEDLNFVHRAWRCSKCFAVSSIKTPFCYECGADMRGGKDD